MKWCSELGIKEILAVYNNKVETEKTITTIDEETILALTSGEAQKSRNLMHVRLKSLRKNNIFYNTNALRQGKKDGVTRNEA